MGKDYYSILGVPKSASSEEIKKTYRRLALIFHPDRNRGDLSAEEHFKEITEAYGVLIDPEKRRLYDFNQSPDFSREKVFNDIFSHPDYSDVFQDLPIKKEWIERFMRVGKIFAYEAMVSGGRPRDIIRRSLARMAIEGVTGLFHNVMDIHNNLSIPKGIAIQGGYITVEYRPGFLSRRIKVKIPANTRKGTTLRVPKMGRKGLGNKSGDLYLHIDIGSP